MEENNQINSEEKSEEPISEVFAPEPSLAEPPSAATETFASEEEFQEPSQFQIFMRKALTWLAVVAVAFLGGFITFYFALYQSKVDQLEKTQATLTETESELTDLEAQLDSVSAQRDALETADDYRHLLSILADTYAARLALVGGNTVAAKSALSDTDETLNSIIDVIRDFDGKLAETLPQRLNLIRTNIDGNRENAIADCDLLIKDLRDIEKALYQ